MTRLFDTRGDRVVSAELCQDSAVKVGGGVSKGMFSEVCIHRKAL